MLLLIDRAILRRFLENFLVLFLLVYLLATTIDVVLQLDEFTEAAHAVAGDDASGLEFTLTLARLVGGFHGPRVFQLYAYLLGLTAVGAMGFTFAQMQRTRELTAILASGTSLHRVAWPVLVAAFGLNILQLVNSNALLPRLAPLLLRDHTDLRHAGLEGFEIAFTADGRGDLLSAARFDPDAATLHDLSVLVRDARGRTVRHLTAERGVWSAEEGAWRLQGGRAVTFADPADPAADPRLIVEDVHRHVTDLSPRVLTLRRYGEFAHMLSTRQIQAMIEADLPVDVTALARVKYGRFSVLLANLLLLVITLPFFLTREPANLLKRSVLAAAVAVPAGLLIFVLMEVELSGVPPAVGVFLPPVLLLPLSLAALTAIRT